MIKLFKNIFSSGMRFIVILLSVISGFLMSLELNAQEIPPRPPVLSVTAQTLSFGAFTYGTIGGSVTIDAGGIRSKSGDIILLGLGYFPSSGKYTVEADPGTLITFMFVNVGPLTNGTGGSMPLQIYDFPLPFITTADPRAPTTFYLGGILTVGDAIANPPGSYNGTFDITLVLE